MSIQPIQRYHEIALRIPSESVELISNYIIENLSGGLLLEDEEAADWTTVKFYLSADVNPDVDLTDLSKFLEKNGFNLDDVTIKKKMVKNLDWIEKYRESVQPLLVGESIVIKPPWSDKIFPGKIEIILEPKMAFGTGRHETSRSCLAEMEMIDLNGKTVLDLGCGSGILSIYAALKGASRIIGYDTDPLAVENSRENFVINKVDALCQAEVGSIGDIPARMKFDVIVVNIIKSVIVPIVGDMKEHLNANGVLILSGLLLQDKDDVERALLKHGLDRFSVRIDGEWLTYRVDRK